MPPLGPTTRRQRIAAGVGLSVLVHGAVALWLLRDRPAPVVQDRPVTVELEVVAPPPAPPPEPEPEPEPAQTGVDRRTRPPRPSTRRPAPASPAAGAPTPTEATAGSAEEAHPLMRMREPGGSLALVPSDATLERALGPVEAPAPQEKPARKPRLPGTGLSTLPAPVDDGKVRLIHPRFYEVLAGTERQFRPSFEKMVDEVRGELSAGKSIKRWLFGGVAGDVEALSNQVPTLACLVCVTLRPNQAPEIELAGASGSAWFDDAATESMKKATVARDPREDFDPARACYRFAAKVWRTRPDLTNLAIPFKINFSNNVKLVSYQKLKDQLPPPDPSVPAGAVFR